MGLDMYMSAKKYHMSWQKVDGEMQPKTPRLVDGMPLKEETMELMYWRKNHWLHGWIVETFADEDDCRPIALSVEQVREIADKLEEWSEDAAALPPTAGFFFGVLPTDEDYIEWRDEYRSEAKVEAAELRRAAQWAEDEPSGEWRSIEYQASW
jgi:hypothetical protein